MTIHVDTSALVGALTGHRRALETLTSYVEQGHRLGLSSIVLFEWLRGPRNRVELTAQEELFPRESVIPFGAAQAEIAARIYRTVANSRSREIDLAVAACALADGAALWTLNPADFKDIPDLKVF